MKKVIVYYSYRGNTKSIAEMIQKSTGADIARIETVVPYDGDYNSVVNQGQDEVNSGYCPEIKPLNIDLSKYDEVILGTPVWWYTKTACREMWHFLMCLRIWAAQFPMRQTA